MSEERKYRLGIIGLGHMGLAIAKGAVSSEYLERYQIAVYDPSDHARKDSAIEGFDYLKSSAELAEKCHFLLLAVRPQQVDGSLEELKDAHIDTLVSIVTGISIAYLQSRLHNVPVIRIMPNTPLQIGEGATALCMSANCPADDYDFIFQLFASMGIARTIPEEKMNDIVAVHGSTPAYVYYFVQCILSDAVKRGIDEESARALLVQTVIGAGELLKRNSDKSLKTFIDEVATEGGTTIEAVQTLEKENMEKIIHDANENCIRRAKELGR